MAANAEMIEALSRDNRIEYGLALRYLAVVNTLDGALRDDIAPILYNLSSDCISHSKVVRGMLVDLGEKTDNSFDSFGMDFTDIDKALRSSFLLERKMAQSYKELAEIAPDDYKSRFQALSNWEVVHMNEVKRAFIIINENTAAMDSNDEILKRKIESLSGNKGDISTVGGSVILKKREEEEKVSEARRRLAEALEKNASPDVLKDVSQEVVSVLGYEKIGMPAMDVLDKDAVDLIWDRRIYAGFCLSCGGLEELSAPQHILLANGLPAVKGKCVHCDSPLFAIL